LRKVQERSCDPNPSLLVFTASDNFFGIYKLFLHTRDEKQ
jgi:hypothetical protein